MTRLLTTTLVLSLFALTSFTQNRIIVQNNTETQVFDHFSDALASAQSGDTIYLPGGAIDIENSYIEKELTIFGAGHYPAFTEATGVTMLNGNIYLLQADPDIPLENIHLEGFYISGNIRIGTTAINQNVNKVNIRRCSMSNLYLSYTTSATGEAEQIHIIENLIRERVYGGYAQNVLFSKNIIQGLVWYLNGNALLKNNIFLSRGSTAGDDLFRVISNTTFENNIILCYYCLRDASANIFNNNMWHRNFSVPPTGSTGDNNIVDLPIDDIFVNHTGHAFSYDFNYHLKEGSPGIAAGTDGFDIGIYGTARPFKEGSVPVIPHIKSKSIATETDVDGKLSVEIEVEAQEE